MKKIILAVALASSASLSIAGTSLNSGFGSGTGKSTLSVDGTGANFTCAYVADGEIVTIQLSKNVVGAFDCNSAGAAVSAANVKGNAKSYTSTSEGGKIVEGVAASIGADESTFQGVVDGDAVAPTGS